MWAVVVKCCVSVSSVVLFQFFPYFCHCDSAQFTLGFLLFYVNVSFCSNVFHLNVSLNRLEIPFAMILHAAFILNLSCTSVELTTVLCVPSSSILCVAPWNTLLLPLNLFMYVVSSLDVSLNTFSWNVSSLLDIEGINCSLVFSVSSVFPRFVQFVWLGI